MVLLLCMFPKQWSNSVAPAQTFHLVVMSKPFAVRFHTIFSSMLHIFQSSESQPKIYVKKSIFFNFKNVRKKARILGFKSIFSIFKISYKVTVKQQMSHTFSVPIFFLWKTLFEKLYALDRHQNYCLPIWVILGTLKFLHSIKISICWQNHALMRRFVFCSQHGPQRTTTAQSLNFFEFWEIEIKTCVLSKGGSL